MKYIETEELKEKISNLENHRYYNGDFHDGVLFTIEEVQSIIDSLQNDKQEVDLEKEINNLDNVYFDLDGIAVVGATYYITVEDLKDIARHFFELGLNAKEK